MDSYTERIVGLERSITRWKRAGLASLISAGIVSAGLAVDRVVYSFDEASIRSNHTTPTRQIVEAGRVALLLGAALFCKIRKNRALTLQYGSPPQGYEWAD